MGSALLFPWTVNATKTATLSPPPDPIQPLSIGTMYPIMLNIEGACNNTTGVCSKMESKPHFPMFGWTATKEIEAQPWSTDGKTWTGIIVGYYLSASYEDQATCIYEWTEAWDITITAAELDGTVWYATAFEGTMVRIEELDQAHSTGRIDDYCPEYSAIDEWAVTAERDFDSIPTDNS